MPTAPALDGARRSGGSGDLRHGNLTHILSYVKDHGPCSRHDIAHGCGLGVSTLTDLIGELRSRRLVRELDPIRRPGAGRPTRPINLDGEPWCVLGVHLDIDAIRVVASTLGGRELWHDTVPVSLRSVGLTKAYPVVAEVLGGQIRRVPRQMELVSLEIGLPGYVVRDRGVLTASRALGWYDVPVRDLIGSLLAEEGITNDLHIGIANDCALAALHASRVELDVPSNAVVVYFGGARVVGGSVIIDGQTFGGAHGGAGELGHLRVALDGDTCWCGRTGCLQTLLGPVALLTRSGLRSPAEAEQLVSDSPQEAMDLLTGEAQAGNERALNTLAEAGEALGLAIDEALGVLNPHAVALGGYLGQIARYLRPALDHRIAPRLSRLAFAHTPVVPLLVNEQRVVRGAVLAAGDACLADPLRLTRIVA